MLGVFGRFVAGLGSLGRRGGGGGRGGGRAGRRERGRVRLGLESLGRRDVPAVVWSGAVDNLWSRGGNWVGGAVPGATDDVTFPSGVAAVDVDVAASVRDFTNNSTAAPVFTINGGLAIGGTASGQQPVFKLNANLTYAGTAIWPAAVYRCDAVGGQHWVSVAAGGTYYCDASSIQGVGFRVEAGGTLTFCDNHGGGTGPNGTLAVSTAAPVGGFPAGGGGGFARVVNAGAIRQDRGGSGNINAGSSGAAFENAGEILLDGAGGGVAAGGTLNLTGLSATSGAGATITVGKVGRLQAYGTGAFSLAGTDVTLHKGASVAGNLALVGGSMTVVSDGVTGVTLDGTLDADGVTFTAGGANPESVTVTGTGAWHLSNCTFVLTVYTPILGGGHVSLWATTSVTQGDGNAAVVTRVGAGTPPAGTWFRYLSASVSFGGTDFPTYTGPAGLQHRKVAGGLEVSFEGGGGPGNEEEETDTAG